MELFKFESVLALQQKRTPSDWNIQPGGVLSIYASSEKNRMLACRFGEHRDNSGNSQSVFLVGCIL